MRRIQPKTHGTLDYMTGLLYLAAPWIFGFYANRLANGVCIVAGVTVLAMALLTNYSAGVLRVIPFRLHLILDMVLGVGLAASPWLFGFSDAVWVPHVVLGLATLAVALFTDPVSDAVSDRRVTLDDRDVPANAPVSGTYGTSRAEAPVTRTARPGSATGNVTTSAESERRRATSGGGIEDTSDTITPKMERPSSISRDNDTDILNELTSSSSGSGNILSGNRKNTGGIGGERKPSMETGSDSGLSSSPGASAGTFNKGSNSGTSNLGKDDNINSGSKPVTNSGSSGSSFSGSTGSTNRSGAGGSSASSSTSSSFSGDSSRNSGKSGGTGSFGSTGSVQPPSSSDLGDSATSKSGTGSTSSAGSVGTPSSSNTGSLGTTNKSGSTGSAGSGSATSTPGSTGTNKSGSAGTIGAASVSGSGSSGTGANNNSAGTSGISGSTGAGASGSNTSGGSGNASQGHSSASWRESESTSGNDNDINDLNSNDPWSSAKNDNAGNDEDRSDNTEEDDDLNKTSV